MFRTNTQLGFFRASYFFNNLPGFYLIFPRYNVSVTNSESFLFFIFLPLFFSEKPGIVWSTIPGIFMIGAQEKQGVKLSDFLEKTLDNFESLLYNSEAV